MPAFRQMALGGVALLMASAAMGNPIAGIVRRAPSNRDQAPCLTGTKKCADVGAPAKACEINGSSKGCAVAGLKLMPV